MKNKKGKKKKLNIRILSVSGFVIVIAITLTIVSNIKEKEIIKEAEEKTLETFASITNENENNEEIIVVEKKQPEINSKTTDWNLILVNKENPIPENYQVLDERQEETQVQKWLIEHCTDYGFILRYPTDKKEITKINYEPWHYRYVGVENAKFMKEKNFCLEEFIAYLKDFE